jgi:dihydroorotate dehydrogenase
MANNIIVASDFEEYQELAKKLKAEGKNPLVIDMTSNDEDIIIISDGVKLTKFTSTLLFKRALAAIEQRIIFAEEYGTLSTQEIRAMRDEVEKLRGDLGL